MENNRILVVRQVFDFRTELDGLLPLPFEGESQLYHLLAILN